MGMRAILFFCGCALALGCGGGTAPPIDGGAPARDGGSALDGGSVPADAGAPSADGGDGGALVHDGGPIVVDGGPVDGGLGAIVGVCGVQELTCSAAARVDGGAVDGGAALSCTIGRVSGACISLSECAALSGCSSVAGYCPGGADIQCCTLTRSVTTDPPAPAGWTLMQQSAVTAEMTAWAVAILQDPTDYPLFCALTRTFGVLLVMARVEWHPPDSLNGVVHRGVTLYQQN
jgi:hypothetical protein